MQLAVTQPSGQQWQRLLFRQRAGATPPPLHPLCPLPPTPSHIHTLTGHLVGCQFDDWKHAADASRKLENVVQSLSFFCCCGREKVTLILCRFLSRCDRNIVQGYNPAASDWRTRLQMMEPAKLPPAHELGAFIECVSMPVPHVTQTKKLHLTFYQERGSEHLCT